MKRQRAEISSNVISHIKSAHPIEMWRSNKLGIKEKISRGNFPRLIFSCPVPSGLPHRSHCVPMNMNPCGYRVLLSCVDRKDTAVKALCRNGFCGYNPFLKRQTAEYPSQGGYSAVHLLIHRFPAQSPFCCLGSGCGWFPRPPP